MVPVAVVCLLASVVGHTEGRAEVQDVVRTLRNHFTPSPITAFLCWEQHDVVTLCTGLFPFPVTVMGEGGWRGGEGGQLFLLDLSCGGAKNFLEEASSSGILGTPSRWLLLGGEGSGGEDQLRGLSLPADGELYLSRAGELFCMYRRNKHGDWGLARDRRRGNLLGAPVRVSFVITDNETIHHLTDYKFKQIDTITKVNYKLIIHVIELINGSAEFSFTSSWGYLQEPAEEGRWSGMIGELVAGRADLGGTPLFVTVDRLPVIDYVAMPTPTRSKFVFRQPKLSYMSNLFLLPFRGPVWAASGALLAGLAGALLLAVRAERPPRPQWPDTLLLAVGALCQQGSSQLPSRPAARLVTLLTFLSLMFLYTSYSANIVALLQSSSSRIHSLQDLLGSRLKLAAHDTLFNRYYFSTATESVRRQIYKKKIAPAGEDTAHFVSLEEGVRGIRKGLFAFHMEIGVGYQVVEDIFEESEKCGLQEIQYLQVVDPWIAMKKNSPYKEMVKVAFRRLQEGGLQARENWRMYTRKPHCSGAGGASNFVSVGLRDCRPALLVLAYGGIIALLLFSAELSYFYNRSRLANILPSKRAKLPPASTKIK